jgi:arylsulfatase A-like enzyme
MTGRRSALAVAVSTALLAAAVVAAPDPPAAETQPPNVILLITDDQPADSWTTPPVGMPWLQARLADPDGGWTWFRTAVASTPMCCPSRASVLTGRPSWETGVVDNRSGEFLDERQTLAVWLHDRGYRTGLFGKYLNGYPWDRGPYIPPGWDRWLAKTNDAISTTYRGYGVVDQGVARRAGTSPGDYVTTVLGDAARGFVAETPPTRPWFLYLATSAPHAPFIPAPGDAGTLVAPEPVPEDHVDAVAAGPAWLRALAPLDAGTRATLEAQRLAQREALLEVDRVLATLWATVEARGEADRTVVIVTSDNGYAFGQHRWVGKRVPYEPSIRIPLAMYVPGDRGGTVDTIASTLDLAPTIAAIAGVAMPWPTPGTDLRGALDPERWVPLAWSGDATVPAWRAVRTTDAILIRWEDGHTEAYDLTADPAQLGSDGRLDPDTMRGLRMLLARDPPTDDRYTRPHATPARARAPTGAASSTVARSASDGGDRVGRRPRRGHRRGRVAARRR